MYFREKAIAPKILSKIYRQLLLDKKKNINDSAPNIQ